MQLLSDTGSMLDGVQDQASNEALNLTVARNEDATNLIVGGQPVVPQFVADLIARDVGEFPPTDAQLVEYYKVQTSNALEAVSRMVDAAQSGNAPLFSLGAQQFSGYLWAGANYSIVWSSLQ